MISVSRVDLGDAELEAVQRVMRSGIITQGPEVEAFESEFASLAVGVTEADAVNSGTSALHLAGLALGLGPGDEVILPSFTFAGSPNSIAMLGSTPVFIVVDPVTFTLDPQAVRAAISHATRAIMAVHLFGQPADLPALVHLAERHGVPLIEDAAQAHLAEVRGRRVGAWGRVAAFSFYPTKNMTCGEGGMVTTSDALLARVVRLLRNQGQAVRYQNEIVGLNNRMTDIHAAIGRVQLTALEERTSRRQANAAFYDQKLEGVVVPKVRTDATHVYHQYTIRVPGHDRDRFIDELLSRGVGSGVYYPTPCHRLAPYAGDRRPDLSQTDLAASEVLSIPVHPHLTDGEREQVVEAVNDVARAGA